MDLSDLIDVPAIMPALKANSKKQLLQLLAERAASITGIPEREIFDTDLAARAAGPRPASATASRSRTASWPA